MLWFPWVLPFDSSVIFDQALGVLAVETAINVKTILVAITPVFILATLFFGTRNGFYDTDKYHGNGSAH